MQPNDMIAVVIAGGSGTRLRPLTYTTPKPMVPLFDKPFLQVQLEWLKRHGIRDVVINLHYLSQAISDHFGDGSAVGMRLRYSYEEEPRGTAGAVKLAEPFLDDRPVLVLNGDILADFDLGRLVAAHRAQRAAATLSTVSVPDPTAYGLIFTDADGRVIRFLEKPTLDEARVDTINAGVYVLDPAVLRLVPQDEPHSFERELFPALLDCGEPVYGFRADGYWLDIGSPPKYQQAHMDVLLGRISIELDAIRRPNGVWFGPDVDLAPTAVVQGPAYLGRGVTVGKHAQVGAFSVLGAGVAVDDRAAVEQAVVGAGTKIGEHAEVARCLVGRRCAIGPEARLGDQVLLADDSVIGRGSLLGTRSERT